MAIRRDAMTPLRGLGVAIALSLAAGEAHAMHIMEGFLPLPHALGWWIVMIPCLGLGLRGLKRRLDQDPREKILLVMATAFTFVLSALKLPSVTGSCSHPTGLGLGTILLGPWAMTVVGGVVLLFQALLLAHGGLSTLGANAFAMGVVGPLVTALVYHGVIRLRGPWWLAVFLAGAMGDLATYVMTSVQLGWAFPDATGGIVVAIGKFLGIFAVTQGPLAISEGILTVMVLRQIRSYGWFETISRDSMGRRGRGSPDLATSF